MKLAMKDAYTLKKSVDAVAVLIDEASFTVSHEGLALKATDPSQIAMVDFALPKKAFDTLSVEREERVGVDMDYLKQVMGRAKDTDAVTLALNEDGTVLTLTFAGTSTRTFSVPLIEVSQTAAPEPKVAFTATLGVRASVLKDALKDAELISTHVVLGVTPDDFYVQATSSKGKLDNRTPKSDEQALATFQVKEEARAMFPLDYLRDMLKTADPDTTVTVSLKTDAPVRIAYPVRDASIAYFLAPRIESE